MILDFILWTVLIFIFGGVKEKTSKLKASLHFFFLVCEHEKPEELGNILLIYFIFNKFITIINLEST